MEQLKGGLGLRVAGHRAPRRRLEHRQRRQPMAPSRWPSVLARKRSSFEQSAEGRRRFVPACMSPSQAPIVLVNVPAAWPGKRENARKVGQRGKQAGESPPLPPAFLCTVWYLGPNSGLARSTHCECGKRVGKVFPPKISVALQAFRIAVSGLSHNLCIRPSRFD